MSRTDENDLLEALMRQAVSQCIDIERLAYLEETLIESMLVDERDRERIGQLVADGIDRTWQELMFEFERLRTSDCRICAAMETDHFPQPFSIPFPPLPGKPT